MTPAAYEYESWTSPEYEALLDVISEQPPSVTIPLLRGFKLGNVGQFRELLNLCDTRGEADALMSANEPCVAYIRLVTPEPEVEELYAEVKSAPTAEAATVAMQAASRDVYETAAARLAMDRITDPESLGAYILQLYQEPS
jgi:hypothetical protein